MSRFVVVTFDINDGEPEDYATVYAELEKLSLRKQLVSDNAATVTLPTTTTAGEFNVSATAAELRKAVADRVQDIFKRNGLHGKIFVMVAGDWAWGSRTP